VARPRLLDLFCGAGGAAGPGDRSSGYAKYFDIVGVDNKPQPHYPFEFHQCDALAYLELLLWRKIPGFDAIHASPPCQRHSALSVLHDKDYPDLIPETRRLLEATGLPWVIENVPGAPLRKDYVLCGCFFRLPWLRRERWFETSWQGFAMDFGGHNHDTPCISVTGHGSGANAKQREPFLRAFGRYPRQSEAEAAMGIDWMTQDELSQAIPPAYTEYIGAQLLRHVRRTETLDMGGAPAG
jgi:DNA (cytosine-5)-methyltransferase 1